MAASVQHDRSSQKQKDVLDDLFHDVIMSEERVQEEGYEEGHAVGERKGLLEGCRLGFQKGVAIGSEIGFYKGFVSTVQRMINEEGGTKLRVEKSLQALEALLSEFPLSDVLNEVLFDDLEKIRSKFKQVTSLLGVNMTYGSRTSEPKGISF